LLAEGGEANPGPKTFDEFEKDVEIRYYNRWNPTLDTIVSKLRVASHGIDDIVPCMDKLRKILAADDHSTKIHPDFKGELRTTFLEQAGPENGKREIIDTKILKSEKTNLLSQFFGEFSFKSKI
jgi:hypothetical protein